MPVEKMIITDEEIEIVEKILLPEGCVFDAERRDFIKCLKTIDLQAVPGSGKTTALLAKLLILEKKTQYENKGGILMLSHTNAAIDEIKRKIGHLCPKLFEYPNFVGTIQSFVDDFLAVPCYSSKYKKRPSSINSDQYYAKLDKALAGCLRGEEWDTFAKVGYIKRTYEAYLKNYRFGINAEGGVILLDELNGQKLVVKKPKSTSKSYVDYTIEEKEKVYNYLKKIKARIMKDGVLHYDDAYFLANYLLVKKPDFKEYLQKRFRFVFVDEMQDMDEHQVDILEKIFFDQVNGLSVYQRIGDKNQAIHGSVSSKDSWGARDVDPLKITGSHRLTPEIASVVSKFGLEFINIQGLKNNRTGNIKPYIIFFTDPTTVLEKFTSIIQENGLANVTQKDGYPFRAVGWTETHEEAEKLGIRSYCPTFKRNQNQSKEHHGFLRGFLAFSAVKNETTTLEPIQGNITKALLRVLQDLGLRDEFDNPYTKSSFFRFLKNANEAQYQTFKSNLYNWSHLILKGSDVHAAVREYFVVLLKELYSDVDIEAQNIKTFLEGQEEVQEQAVTDAQVENPNIHTSNGVKVKVGTIHSVKGETHVATLYLESFYQKKHESNRLPNQINGVAFASDKVYDQQATKMMYVGFSRPTHLLCFAVHVSRRFTPDPNIWNVVE